MPINDAPVFTAEDGRLLWRFPTGETLPVVRGGDGDDDDKTFTQADLDRIVQERLARVKPVETKPADYDDLVAKAAKLAQLEATQGTDLERLQRQLDATTGERDAAAAERDVARGEIEKVTGTLREERIRSAIVTEAGRLKAVDPSQVYALVPKDAVTLGDDGRVTGAENAVKAFMEANPHFVGTTGPRRDPAQGAGNDGDTKSGVAAGRERARLQREAQAQARPAQYPGMTVVGGAHNP